MSLTFSDRKDTPSGGVQRVNGGRTCCWCNVAPPTSGIPRAYTWHHRCLVVITPAPVIRSRSRRSGSWSVGAESRGGAGRRTGVGTGSAGSSCVVWSKRATVLA